MAAAAPEAAGVDIEVTEAPAELPLLQIGQASRGHPGAPGDDWESPEHPGLPGFAVS